MILHIVSSYELLNLSIICILILWIVWDKYHKSKINDTYLISERARETGQVLLYHPRKLLWSDYWLMVRSNSWGVFAQSAEQTIVFFDSNGFPIAELFMPFHYKAFYVEDEALRFVDAHGGSSCIRFDELVWHFSKRKFEVPKPVFKVLDAEFSKHSIRISLNGKKKTVHYLSKIPVEPNVIMRCMFLLCGIIRIVVGFWSM